MLLKQVHSSSCPYAGYAITSTDIIAGGVVPGLPAVEEHVGLEAGVLQPSSGEEKGEQELARARERADFVFVCPVLII